MSADILLTQTWPAPTTPKQEAIVLIVTCAKKALEFTQARVKANDLIPTTDTTQPTFVGTMSQFDKECYISRRDAAMKAFQCALKMYSAHHNDFLGPKPFGLYDGYMFVATSACQELSGKAHCMAPEAELINPWVAACKYVAEFVPMR